VTLKSANPEDLPTVSPNWLSARADQELAIAIVKRIREAFESSAMADVLVGDEYFPGKAVQSDEQILEYVKDNLMTIWHPACTCKMGTPQDPLAVVDSKARVFGVTGLRVVDASSFTILPPGHPQAMVCKSLIISDRIPSFHGIRQKTGRPIR
jgi:choline dehydrogenase-like flavoprotein